jgi:cation transport ATPase
MQATFKTTLNCGSCVSKVTPGLNRIEGLHNWSVDTSNPDKRLTASVADREVATQIVAAIQEAGFEANPESTSGDGDNTPRKSLGALPVADSRAVEPRAQQQPPIRVSTYWPLILVVAYIVTGMVYVQWATGNWSWHHGMSLFMGLFFLGFAFFKLLNVPKFADAFSSYDLIATHWRGYALAYPFIELTLGFCYLLGLFPVATNVATIAVMGIGLIGVIRAVAKRQAIQCACLGTAFNLPMSSVTIIENSSMVLMAAAMLVT